MLRETGNCSCLEYIRLPFEFDHLASTIQRITSSDEPDELEELDELDEERFNCPNGVNCPKAELPNNVRITISKMARCTKPPATFRR